MKTRKKTILLHVQNDGGNKTDKKTTLNLLYMHTVYDNQVNSCY